ncbi:MAG: hypothetical protein FWH43_00675 [Endomicrobia bacterium]|nr:hypothetical protein [Endomicrobiia bacterium]
MKIKFMLLIAAAVCLFSCSGTKNTKEPVEDEYLTAILKAAEDHNKTMVYIPAEPFTIYDPGTDEWVDYEKYGEFQNIGTDKYRYAVKDSEALRAASGEGIFPNTQSVYESPEYKKLAEENKLDGLHWNFVNTDDFQANFYKWATTREDPGVKLYFTALALERSGNIKHAIKAYYACLVFFPKAVGWTEWKTPWYIAPVCISKIKFLTKKHPELGIKLEGADITVHNAFDNDIRNDVYEINPGKLVPADAKDFERQHIDLKNIPVKKTTGTGKVKLVQYENNHFQLTVDGKPYVVRAMTYNPNRVGVRPVGEFNNIKDFSFEDINNNGRIDGPFDAWVDANRNDMQDPDEKPVGDFALMEEMGINTLRLYHAHVLNKELLNEGYEKYGFMYMVGNLAGMYVADTGATWEEGTDYSNPEHRKKILESVKTTVEIFKEEPYVLMWVLGNENNYGDAGSTNADQKPEEYYTLVNECVLLIKSLDLQNRPVAISNGDLAFLDYCVKYAPDLDIFGTNAYRGEAGFGNIWKDIMNNFGKPVVITEYGCPAYAAGWSMARAEEGQASYHKGNWEDIEDNLAGVAGGVGNALGGVIFEWSDEWWKAGGDSDPFIHATHSQMGGAFLDGRAYEEWFGLCSLGDGADSQFKRQLRKSYFMYRDLWRKYK